MVRSALATAAILALGATTVAADVPVTLKGSPASMVRQNQVARESGGTFFRTAAEIHAAVERGDLVPVEGTASLAVNRISFPYAHPAMRLFLERFADQYRAACGESLVVTSLTRALDRQPPNAHRLSVHPTGLAADLRISQTQECRAYLESTLLAMEADGVLDITRERTPPHYHLALFPEAYLAWSGETEDAAAADPEPVPATLAPAAAAGAASLLPSSTAGEEETGGWIRRILSLPSRIFRTLWGS